MSYFAYQKEDLEEFVKSTIKEMKKDKNLYFNFNWAQILIFLEWIYDNEDLKLGGW